MITCKIHPEYRGLGAPVLSCRECCQLFIAQQKNAENNVTGLMEYARGKYGNDWRQSRNAVKKDSKNNKDKYGRPTNSAADTKKQNAAVLAAYKLTNKNNKGDK